MRDFYMRLAQLTKKRSEELFEIVNRNGAHNRHTYNFTKGLWYLNNDLNFKTERYLKQNPCTKVVVGRKRVTPQDLEVIRQRLGIIKNYDDDETLTDVIVPPHRTVIQKQFLDDFLGFSEFKVDIESYDFYDTV